MLIFFVFALLMILISLAFIFVPLLRPRATKPPLSEAVSNVAVYQSQRREIEEELARGGISTAEHEAAMGELAVRVTDDVPAGSPAAEAAAMPTPPWWLITLIAVLLPVGAALLYGAIGTPRAIDGIAVAPPSTAPAATPPTATGGDEPPMSDKQILAMVDSLAQKMQQNPDDPRGWILLARSQNALGRYPEAAAAYERAVALNPKDAQLLADYADAAVMTQQGRFEGKPYALIKQALAIEPNNMKALALAGTAELRMGNRAASLLQWEKLQSLLAKDSPDYKEVEAIIAEVKTTKLDAPAAVAKRAATVAVAPPAAAAKPGVKLSGRVALAPEVAKNLAPGDTLFVFARAKEGPRMPLAVMRVAAPMAGGFPLPFELTDAMAMAPGMTLSAFSEVIVEARISKSGNAQLQPGDLSGVSGVVKPGMSGVTVTLSTLAP